ncbi:MAG: hypothetical protein EXS14_04565 [Planctomycetes bacterium]|nr:hypothetical protein [Planctomycetota bacterium]
MAIRIFLSALCLLGVIAAQPVFSPPVRPKPPTPEAGGAAAPIVVKPEVPSVPPPDPIEALMQRLSSWPQPRAREASLVLSGLGNDSASRLIVGLAHNDWRVQSGCAWALGEMREARAVQPLRLAISDPSNRAGLPELMAALVRIDPRTGTAAVLPMLTHASARVRQAASRALPQELDQEYLGSVLALLATAKGPGKATALELLARIPGARLREEFYSALSDPEPAVAAAAAEHLGKQADAGARTRLGDLARQAPARAACYALVALVVDEDLHGGSAVPLDAEQRARLTQWLQGKDPFHRGCAAIALANITWVSSAPDDRRLADTVLVPVLIDTVAGGVFFSDYTSLEGMVWRKLALLSGRSFGQDAFSWKRWWVGAAEGFHAHRELRGLGSEEAARAEWSVQQVQGGRVQRNLTLAGPAISAQRAGPDVIILEAAALQELLNAVQAAEFFSSRGDPEDAARSSVETWITVALPEESCKFRRISAGTLPAPLQALVELAERLALERAWQRFVHGATPAERAANLANTTQLLESARTREARAGTIADLAIGAWPALNGVARNEAAGMLRAMDSAWRKSAAERIATALLKSGIGDECAAELAGQVAGLVTADARGTLIEACLRGSSQDKLLGVVLATLAPQDLSMALASEHPRVRAAAATALGKSGAAGVAEQLLGGLRDEDSKMREACLTALAGLRDPRTAALLENLLAGEDRNLRARAIMALGAVMGEQGVARAMEFWHGAERPERAAVLKALAAAGGPRAKLALQGIVREAGDIGLRREALEILARLDNTVEMLRDVLEHADVGELQMMALGALATQLGTQAVPIIEPWLSATDPLLARSAALALARLGIVTALQPLLARLLVAPEGDQAVELALEGLTFQVAREASPPRRAEEFRVWNEAEGAKLRSEWFLSAASSAGVPLDVSVDWLQARGLTVLQHEALIRLVEKGSAPLRVEADRILRDSVVSAGAPLAPLAPRCSNAEAATRAVQWRARIGPER